MYLLQRIAPSPRITESLAEDWMLVVIVIIIALLAFVKYSYSKNFKELFSAAINVRMLREILREEMVLTSRASQILMLIAFLSISLFTYLLLAHYELDLYDLNLKGSLLFGLIVACYLVFYILFMLSIAFLKTLFSGDYSLTEYEFNVSLFLKVLGLSLLPVCLILIYSTSVPQYWMIVLGLMAVLVSVLWRYTRGLLTAMNHGISIFYIILYLCTFEILPFAVFLKVVLFTT